MLGFSDDTESNTCIHDHINEELLMLINCLLL